MTVIDLRKSEMTVWKLNDFDHSRTSKPYRLMLKWDLTDYIWANLKAGLTRDAWLDRSANSRPGAEMRWLEYTAPDSASRLSTS